MNGGNEMKSKAISPLIATLLLIAVALVIAGILYVWSSAYFSSQLRETEEGITVQTQCTFAGINIKECDLNTTSNEISILLENTGQVDFTKDFTIQADDGNNVANGTYTEDLSKGTFNRLTCKATGTTCTMTGISNLTSLNTLRVTPTDCPQNYDETTNCTTSD